MRPICDAAKPHTHRQPKPSRMDTLFDSRGSRPIGPEPSDRGVLFRIWAPRCQNVRLAIFEREQLAQELPMERAQGDYFSVVVPDVRAGTRYAFCTDDSGRYFPDPASRFQPEGVHKPSEVIDANAFLWTDSTWKGVKPRGQIVYELHIGAFTAAGTFAAAIEKLSHLAELGVTIIEVMPVNEFSGDFGWGYDGVHWFAPTRLYGRPDDFRSFVDAAHALGLGVILDVVYNHFGPCGNYTGVFSADYESPRHTTDWGAAINFDGPNARAVRELVTANARYWIQDFHLDGLRLDATQSIVDDSPTHILAELSAAVREAAGLRSIVLIAENEFQEVRHVAPIESGGFGLDSLWNDDFHHACRVAATGQTEGYYVDYSGSPQELISATRWGYLYHGQWNARQQKRRGTPTFGLSAERFVNFLENHDQVANSAFGLRPHLLTSPGRWRALTTLLLMAPGTPMLFMGQEFMASSPFLYFADVEPDLFEIVRDGRWSFLRQFSRVSGASNEGLLPDSSKASFNKSKLDWQECERHTHALALHRDLIRLRKHDQTFSAQDISQLFGAVIGPEAFLLRWVTDSNADRLLIVNLGRDFRLSPVAEPLMAPPLEMQWQPLWSSDDPKYGGPGVSPTIVTDQSVQGHAATIFSTARHH
jgi:maltooligosyltrehalose trehalohydrolase